MEESDQEMSPLELSGDSIRSTKKRQRELSSEEEILPAKKLRNSTEKELPASNGTVSTLATDDIENITNNKIMSNTNLSNNHKNIPSSTNILENDSYSIKSEEKENKESSSQDTNNSTNEIDNNDSHNTSNKSELTDTSEKSVVSKNTESVPEHTPKKENANVNVTTSSTKDTEVVDGLELSVECASDKEETSSESDKDNDTRPRKKTIIVKAKPNESELDVSSSEKEESSEQNLTDSSHTQKNLKQGKRRTQKSLINTKKTSVLKDSSDSSVHEEENKLQYKKKTKRSPNKKKTKSLSEIKRDHDTRKINSRKQDKNSNNDDDMDDDSDDDKDNDIEKNDNKKDADRVNKSIDEDKDEKKHISSDSETSSNGNESDNDNTDKSKDSKKRKRGSTRPEDDKRIQSLKKYIRAAGITVKSYQEIWSGCKSNTARVQQLKSLLEKHGVSGRPTLEKCKKVKERNERLKEVSELDTSNIISEGRVTRSRRGMDSNKNSIISPETPSRHREARNTYKRIKTVIDSDSE
ncbi:hypothetical protein KPH14_010126 [Odynerus spinipes]|uniref:HIRA-interacting protein 3 n=1 Tax=Odynerus spinipes TaxID=1348599 RepID=A0AAD9VSJ3_9HYME|nr:hypothetical protein KPH14_010126 [Odynerus spinipes]